MSGRYNPGSHSRPLVCPDCSEQNAPPDSDEYTEECFECGHNFETPVSAGDEVTVSVTDIHESGRGVGHLESGFIVLVSGALPTSTDGEIKEVDVVLNRVTDSYAEAQEVLDERVVEEEEAEDTDEESQDSDESDDDDDVKTDEETERGISHEPLGSREDHWGGD